MKYNFLIFLIGTLITLLVMDMNGFVKEGGRFTYDDGVVLHKLINSELTEEEIDLLYGDIDTEFKKYLKNEL